MKIRFSGYSTGNGIVRFDPEKPALFSTQIIDASDGDLSVQQVLFH